MHNHTHTDVYYVVLQSVLQQTKLMYNAIYRTYDDKTSGVLLVSTVKLAA
jgi:hypothetical protein